MSDESRDEARRSPLEAFARHQVAALEEVGKAIVSLLPKEFRKHTASAIDEGKAGFEALYDGVKEEIEELKDDVEYRIDCLKRAGKGKTPVEIEGEDEEEDEDETPRDDD